MVYVGLDVHKCWTTVAALDPDSGEVWRFDRVPNTRADFAEVLRALPEPRRGVLESGRNSWALHDQVRPLFEELYVADAAELKRRMSGRGAKTDRKDALKMALVLAEGRVPAVWVPSLQIRDVRTLTRGKVRLTQLRTQVINQVRSLCALFGQECPASSLRTQKAQVWLQQLALPPLATQMLQRWIQIWQLLETCVAEAEQQIEQVVAHDEEAQRIQTMPGVGAFTALTVVAEIGDVRRFDSAKALIGYSGLAPQVHQSGERTRHGPLPHSGNPWLRYVMVLAAQHVACRRTDSVLRRRYWRTHMRHGPNPAKIATARKMLALAYHLLRRREDYQEKLLTAA